MNETHAIDEFTSYLSQPLPTHMYHGTAAINRESILSDGIRPRGKLPSNWPDQPSHPNFVYLTSNQGFEHGRFHSEDHKVIVFEVALSELNIPELYPDEDFVADFSATILDTSQTYKKLLPIVRDSIRDYKDAWTDSIRWMGSLAHCGKIPSECITRYCIVDFSLRPELAVGLEMPTSSIWQYNAVQSRSTQNTRWYFGDAEELHEATSAREHLEACNRKNTSTAELRLRDWLAQSSNRTGIEVVTLRDSPSSLLNTALS